MRFLPLAVSAGFLTPVLALAAGGHHAVDDAAIAEPGQCTVELWAERGDVARRQLQHAGLGCNLMGVEAGLNLDRETARNSPSRHVHGVQLKWATDLQPQLAIGLVAALSWQDQTPTSQPSLLVPLSWRPREDLALHLNLGRSFPRGDSGRTQRGIAVEWQVSPQWQLLAEAFHDGQKPLARLGIRRDLSDRLSLDLTVARANAVRQTPRETWWTVGANWTFGR